MNNSILAVVAVIAFIGGYYFTYYQSEEAVIIDAGNSVDSVVQPQNNENSQAEEPGNSLLRTPLKNLNGLPSTVGSINSEYYLVNFWATWCKPCVEEMPMLNALQRDMSSAQFSIVGLAIDAADPAKKMVDRLEITYPIFIADLEGPELMANNGNEQGLLPYTLLLDAGGNMLASKLGTVNEQDIRAWLEAIR